MKRKIYEKPSVEVVEIQQQCVLMASGEAPAPTSASFDDYEDGGSVTWD